MGNISNSLRLRITESIAIELNVRSLDIASIAKSDRHHISSRDTFTKNPVGALELRVRQVILAVGVGHFARPIARQFLKLFN
jgi:hypothetical protein